MFFKMYWKNGTTSVIEGNDIADACNKAGYDEVIYLDSLQRFSEVIPATPSDGNVENKMFSCGSCYGPPATLRLEDGKYYIKCSDCGNSVDARFEEPLQALITWNRKQQCISDM